MYERLLDKNDPPTEDAIRAYIGKDACALLQLFEEFLDSHYDMHRELKFPFGNHYGWGYKYSHKTSHLCYVFFESGAVTVTLQLGDNCAAKVKEMLPRLSPKANELWRGRYPCGQEGGWLHDRVFSEKDLGDIFEWVMIKRKPSK